MIVWSLCTFPEHHIFQGLNIKQETSAIQSASSRALWSFASFQQKSKSKPLRNYPVRLRNECTEILHIFGSELEGEERWEDSFQTASSHCHEKFLKKAAWNVTPSAYQRSTIRLKICEFGDISPRKVSKSQKKKQPAIQILKRTKNQKGEEPGYFLVIFGSLHQLNFEIFYIGMLDSEVFPYNFGNYISITDRNYFQPSPYSFVISLAHLWFIPQPQLSIYN